MNKSRARSVSGRPFLALSGKMEIACDTLRAMSHETRLKILCLLDEGEMPVNRIADAVGQSVSTVSQHLSKLRSADLVTSRRDGQTILYASRGDPSRTTRSPRTCSHDSPGFAV